MAQNLGNETTTIVTEGPELIVERVFDAPRELVWEAFTDPKHVPNWWGPYDTTATVVEMDVRPGGTWRWISHSKDGQDAPFTGEYLEVVPPERLVRTEIYDVEPFNQQAAVETLTLEAVGNRTKVTSRTRFPDAETLDGALATGMTRGIVESYDRIAELVAGLGSGRGAATAT